MKSFSPSLRALGLGLIAAIALSAPAAAGAPGWKKDSSARLDLADFLTRVDGAQALVGAVLYVDQEQVLEFGLVDLLSDRRARLMVFAPTNEAFERLLGLPAGYLDGLSAAEIRDALPGLVPADAVAAILLEHVATFRPRDGTSLDSLLARGSVEAVDGSTLAIGIGEAGVRINDANVVRGDVRLRNGVVHFIDEVL